MSRLVDLDPDTMTREELAAWADYFWSDVAVKLSPADLANLSIAVLRAKVRPRRSDDDNVWAELSRKLTRLRAEVER